MMDFILNFKQIFIFLIFLIINNSFSNCDPVVELIKAAGYPVEVHYVYTSDGFKLRLHRIPKGVKKLNYEIDLGSDENSKIPYRNETEDDEPIFLMHGLLCASGMWIAESTDKSLGFMLADAGYDVWMLSARGTTLSSSHKTLDSDSQKYWDFSFHEIGYYDVPAGIKYVLQKTRKNKVRYVGHSQGCTVFGVALTMHPELNRKISSAYLMTPAIYLHHMSSMVKAIVGNEREIQEIANMMRIYGIQIKSPISSRLSDYLCQQASNGLCSDMLFRIIGGDSGQLDKLSFIPMMTKNVVDNISVKQLGHFAQLVHNAKFAMYDHGTLGNYKNYKSNHPPEYDLSKISVPITVIYGSKDGLVSSTDVELFMSKVKNVRRSMKLPWNHLDFIYGKDVDVRVNDYIIRSIKKDAIVEENLAKGIDICVNSNETQVINICKK
uniref:Lipase n=1 Tax=Culicoides sonorensis TaxID=179676 RepID=A0A336KHF7_CULSO